MMVKATALVSIIGLDDMVNRAGLAAASTRSPFTFYVAVALIYLTLTSKVATTISIQIYRTLVNGSNFYRVTSIAAPTANSENSARSPTHRQSRPRRSTW